MEPMRRRVVDASHEQRVVDGAAGLEVGSQNLLDGTDRFAGEIEVERGAGSDDLRVASQACKHIPQCRSYPVAGLLHVLPSPFVLQQVQSREAGRERNRRPVVGAAMEDVRILDGRRDIEQVAFGSRRARPDNAHDVAASDDGAEGKSSADRLA
jgi:hypothetical protein